MVAPMQEYTRFREDAFGRICVPAVVEDSELGQVRHQSDDVAPRRFPSPADYLVRNGVPSRRDRGAHARDVQLGVGKTMYQTTMSTPAVFASTSKAGIV
jgi:hypothetical protein